MVDDVDVEIAVDAAAGPEEAVEAANLELHLAHCRPASARIADAGTVHAIAAHEDDVADLAAVDPLGHLLKAAGVMGIQAHAHLEPLLFRLLGQLQHAAGGRAVGRQRLLHEDVQSLLDRVGEMHPAKRQRGGKHRHVARLQTVHRLLVGVEAGEPAILGHVHLIAKLLLERLVTAIEPILESIGHGDQLHGAMLDVQGVGGGAGAASAATDQGHANGVVFAGVDVRNGRACQRRGGGNPSGGFQEFTTRGAGRSFLGAWGASLVLGVWL